VRFCGELLGYFVQCYGGALHALPVRREVSPCYRSGEPLRHPKARTKPISSASQPHLGGIPRIRLFRWSRGPSTPQADSLRASACSAQDDSVEDLQFRPAAARDLGDRFSGSLSVNRMSEKNIRNIDFFRNLLIVDAACFKRPQYEAGVLRK
jgi:hypothetical protein